MVAVELAMFFDIEHEPEVVRQKKKNKEELVIFVVISGDFFSVRGCKLSNWRQDRTPELAR